jgi:uncharacterized protein YbjT (DUF2867 family)
VARAAQLRGRKGRAAAGRRRAAVRAAEARSYSAGMPRAAPPTVLIAGASGLIGRALLTQLLDEDRATVHALLRREVGDLPDSDRLTRRVIDFANPGTLPRADELYIALGTTIKVAGSKSAFRAVDFDAVVNVARAAHAAGVERCAVVSALGANARSKVFYNQVKGEMERALHELRFERLVIARPSLLAGAREELGQPARLGERLTLAVLQPLSNLIPASVRPIEAAVVARAMRLALRTEGLSRQVLASGALQQLGQVE